MALIEISPPPDEPVSVVEAKLALRFSGTYSWGIASNNASLGLGSYANDAASAGGVPVGMTYVNSSTGAVTRRLV